MTTRQSAIEVFEKQRADFAAITTFGFDPVYFERRVLRTKALERASRIVVFMDASEWAKLLERSEPARRLNDRYLVVPVPVTAGVFHPKLVLLLGDDSISVACNSANLTRAGYSHNLELLNTGESSNKESDAAVLQIGRKIIDFLTATCESSPDSAPMRIAREWLASLSPLPEVGDVSGDMPGLWATHEEPLWSRVEGMWRDAPPDEVWVLSPFFDKRNDLLKRLVELLDAKCDVSLVAQNGTSLLDAIGAKRIVPSVGLFDIQGDARRRLHAKMLAWRTGDRWSSLVGSANWTRAAFDGSNAEAVLYLPETSDWRDQLLDDDLEIKPIEASEFETGPFDAPEDEEEPAGRGLRLRSAELTDRKHISLELEWSRESEPDEVTLDIWCGHDLDPRASVPVRLNGKFGRADIPPTLELGHGIRVAVRVQAGDEVLITPKIWVIRRDQLEREIGEGGGSSRQRHIRETGEGLEAYLDELAAASGPSAAVDYLRALSLRFDSGDGVPGGRAGVFRIKVHDPFTGEGAPEWWTQLSGEADDLKAAIADFVDRHQRQRLLKHAKHGNINGLENFLDIFSCLVRLVHRYHVRDQKLVPRGMVISRFCDFAEIASCGIEAKGEIGPGYLDTVAANLRSDRSRLETRCQETEFSECVRATIWLAQCARARNEYPRVVDPHSMLRSWVERVTASLANAGLGHVDDTAIERGLRRVGLSDAEVAVAKPGGAAVTTH